MLSFFLYACTLLNRKHTLYVHCIHIHQAHRVTKFIVVYPTNNGILLSVFRKYIIPFGMFLSYIIAASFFSPYGHNDAALHRRSLSSYILFKFPKLPRRGPNTKLNLFISLTFNKLFFSHSHSLARSVSGSIHVCLLG